MLRQANARCSALLLLRWLGLRHRLSDLRLLPIYPPFPEISFGTRWLFTVLRAWEDSEGLWGFCKFYLLVWCCWVFLANRSCLGAGSPRGCAYIHTFFLFVHEHASRLPSWECFYFEWRHNQNCLSTSWQVVGDFEFKPGLEPSTVASPVCQRSHRSPLS